MCYVTDNNTKDDKNILGTVPTRDLTTDHQIPSHMLFYYSVTALQSQMCLYLDKKMRGIASYCTL